MHPAAVYISISIILYSVISCNVCNVIDGLYEGLLLAARNGDDSDHDSVHSTLIKCAKTLVTHNIITPSALNELQNRSSAAPMSKRART